MKMLTRCPIYICVLKTVSYADAMQEKRANFHIHRNISEGFGISIDNCIRTLKHFLERLLLGANQPHSKIIYNLITFLCPSAGHVHLI